MRSASAAARPAGSVDPGFADLVEELTARLHAGEVVDEDALLREHPEHAERLRELLPALRLLADLSRSGPQGLAGVLGPEGEQAACSRLLGDFRIVREVGRGGMGVVYEAEQLSLGRRVALKVLPFAATLDPRHLQRFHNEARAAAGLHHEHIVPVYGVGSERGVHFYAMQFVDGLSLAELIARQRRPAPATESPGLAPAEGPGDDARTTAYSPARAPEPPTARGRAGPTEPGPRDAAYFRRVAGWGIDAAEALEHAHGLGIVHRDVKPGNLMLDAAGKLWVTDFGLARTPADSGLTMTGDLLGTLRYMSPEQALAKHNLVDHRTDVYSLGATLYELLTLRPAVDGVDRQEVLHKIAVADPENLRAIDPAIPHDLETVVLKAMAKEPAERYATAQELADDLRRFREHRPIRARRPSLAQRLEKLLRRHRRAAVAVTAGLFVASVLLAGCVAWVWNEKEKARRASLVATQEKENAEKEQKRAEANLGKALAAVDRMLTRVASNRLPSEPRMEKVRRALLEDALKLCQEVVQDNPGDQNARFEVGIAHRRVGSIRNQLGQQDQAIEALRQAATVLGRLSEQSPDHARARLELASARTELGAVLNQAGRPDEGRKEIERAIALLEAPEGDSSLTPTRRKALAEAYNSLGGLHRDREQRREARRAFNKAVGLLRTLLASEPRDADVRIDLGACLNNLAVVQPDLPASPRAAELLEEAAAHQRAALRLRPGDLWCRTFLRNHRENLAITWHALGKGAEAVKAMREVVRLGEEFVREFPDVPSYRADLFRSYMNCGMSVKRTDPREAERLYRRALEVGEKLVKDFPAVPAYRRDLATGYHNLVLRIEPIPGRGDDVVKASERAITLFEGLKEEELTPTARCQLAACYLALDTRRRLAGRPDEAAAPRRQAIRHLEKVVASRRDHGGAWRLLAQARRRDGAWKEELAAFAEVRRLGLTGGRDLFNAATAHWHLGDREQARGCFDEGEAWLKKNAGGTPADRSAREEAAKLLGVPGKP